MRFELRRSEQFALVGASRSGKSTLLSMLSGMFRAQSGTSCIGGVPQPGLRHAGALATRMPQAAEIFECTSCEKLCCEQNTCAAELKRAL